MKFVGELNGAIAITLSTPILSANKPSSKECIFDIPVMPATTGILPFTILVVSLIIFFLSSSVRVWYSLAITGITIPLQPFSTVKCITFSKDL